MALDGTSSAPNYLVPYTPENAHFLNNMHLEMVCGRDKGRVGGLGKYEFGSIYNYQIPELIPCKDSGVSNEIVQIMPPVERNSSENEADTIISTGGDEEVEAKRSSYSFMELTDLSDRDLDSIAPWLRDPIKPPPSVVPVITSCVSSVHLGRALNLEKIAKHCTNLRYNPNNFIPLMMYLKKPRTTAMIFQSGNMVVNGAKSVEDARVSTRRFARKIQKVGYRVSVAGWQIHNMTCSVNLGFKIRMNEFAEVGNKIYKGKFSFDQEGFSGVTVQMSSNRGKVLVFQTGRAVIAGVKTLDEAHEALNFIYPLARLYAK